MNIHFNPVITALRFFFKRNHRVPVSALPGRPADPGTAHASTFSSTWLGHSSVLIRLGRYRVLTDPVLVSRVTPAGPSRFPGTLSLTPEQLGPVDLVLISHDHYDHLNRTTIEAIHPRTGGFAVPRGVGNRLIGWGVSREKIRELDWWEGWEPLPGIRVTATPARHFSGRGLWDRNRTLWASWVIQWADRRLFFSGDSGYFDGFADIGRRLGPFDVTFLECGAYDPAWHPVHMFPQETVQAHQDLGGSLLHPIHWATFNLALHPWYDPMERVAEAAERAGIPLATPVPGQILDLTSPRTASGLGTRWWKPLMARQQSQCPMRVTSR